MKVINIFVLMLALILVPAMVNAQSSPVIKLDISNYDPVPVQPGEFVDVWVTVQNTGSIEARDIIIEFLESPYFELVNSDEEVREIPVLGANKDYVLKYKFKVADDIVEGANQLRFEYSLGSSPSVITTANLRLDVKSTEVPLSVSSVRLTPDPVEPGQRTELTIAITNPTTSSNLRDVSVSLQLAKEQGATVIDLPFAPIDSTNTKSISRILPGQTTEFRFSLIVYPDAESQIYKIPVLFTYFDDTGRSYDKASFVSINVNSEPDLYVIVEGITLDARNKQGEVIFDIVNQGISNVKLLSVTLDESDSFKLTSTSNKDYLGNIDSDDFKSARFRITANENVTDLTFPVTLTFRDALNNEFTQTYEINHTLNAPASNGGSSSTIIVILIIVGVVAIIFYRRRQKKRRLQVHDDDD